MADERKKGPNRTLKILGEATGATPAWNIAQNGFLRPIRGSVGRVQGLVSGLRYRDDPDLPAVDPSIIDARDRFETAMGLHEKTDRDIALIVSTTHKQAVLYLFLTMVAVSVGVLSFRFAPLTGSFSDFTAIARFAVAPLVGALAFRAAYTNWMMRHRRLSGPVDYLRSRDWFTKPAS